MSVITIKMRVDLLTLNMLASISNAFGFTLGPAKLIATMVATVSTKDHPILIKKGIS
jgi:hypothetical protein